MDKVNRNYLLRIQKNDLSFLEVRPPFTIEFEVHRNSFSSANACSLRIYNLNETNRSQILFNIWDSPIFRDVEFYAGYGDHLSIAYKGNVFNSWSIREGNNFISQIESFDAGFAYANAVVTEPPFPAGTRTDSVVQQIAEKLPGVQIGAIGSFPQPLARDTSYDGNSIKVLDQITNGGFYIDSGKAYALNEKEALGGNIPTISVANGLLGTPVREEQTITLEMLFEPGLVVGQLVNLISDTAYYYNGIYKIISLKHRGIISESVSGQAVTSVGLLSGEFASLVPRL